MVGDSVDDILAGYEAGAVTVLLKSPGKEDLEQDERTHVAIDRYVSTDCSSSGQLLTMFQLGRADTASGGRPSSALRDLRSRKEACII